MATRAQSHGKAKTPAQEEAARQKVVGPRGKKLVDTKPNHNQVEDTPENLGVVQEFRGGQAEEFVGPMQDVDNLDNKAVDHEDRRHSEAPSRRGDDVMNFATSQLTTPAVHAQELSEEEKKHLEFAAAVAKIAQDMGIAIPQMVQKKARSDRKQNNNITRPAEGTITGNVWAVADEITQQTGSPASVAAMKSHQKLRDVNLHTIKTQYARWRAFNGISGRVVQVVVKEVPSTREELASEPE